MIELGIRQDARTEPNDGHGELVRVLCDDRELRPHIGAPWFRHWLYARLGIEPERETNVSPAPRRVVVSEETLARHALVCGATGSGKTRLCLHLVAEQMKAGASVVMLDPKADTLRHLLSLAHDAGIAPQQVSLLWPRDASHGVPGWNPLQVGAGLSAATVAQDFVSVLAQSTTSWGPRLQDILTNALIVIATHGLSLIELSRFLRIAEYRDALLAEQPSLAITLAYREARGFFEDEFARWSAQEQTVSIAPVLNKLREFLRNPFLRTLLCARRTTLPLCDLWQEQRLLLVHLDRTTLGDDGVRLLSGLLAWQMYRTAMRAEGSRRAVVLALDEMGVSEQFLGSAVGEILAIARSQHLRLLLAFQHFGQLSDDLRTALLANAGLQVFFRLGYTDARIIGAALPEQQGETPDTLTVEVSAGTTHRKDPEMRAWAEVCHSVTDASGNRLRLSSAAWRALTQTPLLSDAFLLGTASPPSGTVGAAALSDVRQLARLSGVDRLYVETPDMGEPVALHNYVQGIPPSWVKIVGPAPIQLVIRFPRPKHQVIQRESETEADWARTLQELAPRHAVVSVAGEGASVMRAVHVPDMSGFAASGYLNAVLLRSGQSSEEVAQTEAWREERQQRLTAHFLKANQAEETQHTNNTKPPSPRYPKDATEAAAPASATRNTTAKPAVKPQAVKPKAAGVPRKKEEPVASAAAEQVRPVNRSGEVAEDGSLA